MGHGIEGDDLVLTVGEKAWHGLDVNVQNAPSIREALALRGPQGQSLDWTVAKEPVYVPGFVAPIIGESANFCTACGETLAAEFPSNPGQGEGNVPLFGGRRGINQQCLSTQNDAHGRMIVPSPVVYVPVPEQFAMRRSTDGKILGIVGPDYVPLQNAEAFAWFDPAIQDGTATLESAGTLRGGRIVWVMARIGAGEVLPGDEVGSYLLLSTAHDGTRRVQSRFTPIRVVCNNTLTAAEAGQATIAIRHTSGMHAALEEAGRVIGLARKESGRTLELYQHLAKVSMTPSEITGYVKEVFPDNPEAESNTRTENIRKAVAALVEGGRGSEIKGVRGTLWGAYNAITEYVDHERGVPDSGKLSEEKAATRLESVWFGSGAAIKARALQSALDRSGLGKRDPESNA